MDQDTKMEILESSNFSFNKESEAMNQPDPTQNDPSLPLFSNTPTNLLSEIGSRQVSDLPNESNLATQPSLNPQNNQYKILGI
jgi:hypothetical protein